jgi:cell division protein FtsQ
MRLSKIKYNFLNYALINNLFRRIKYIYNNSIKIILKIFLLIIVIILIVFIGLKIFKPNLISLINSKSQSLFFKSFNLDNLDFKDIEINGNNRVSRDEIIIAIENYKNNLEKNPNIDGNNTIQNIQNLIDELKIKFPWIDKITLKRILPDKLKIEIIEYQPFAIWFDNDKKFIIDKEGNAIDYRDEYEKNAEFQNMIVLSGKNANNNVKSLFNILTIDSNLNDKIYSATWIGNRRWDIRFYDGLLVKLPEVEISKAWNELIKIYDLYQHDRNIKSIDLRVDGKIYLQYFNKKSQENNVVKS